MNLTFKPLKYIHSQRRENKSSDYLYASNAGWEIGSQTRGWEIGSQTREWDIGKRGWTRNPLYGHKIRNVGVWERDKSRKDKRLMKS
jgi:hypothetical protein